MTMAASLHLNLLHHLRRSKPLYASRAPPLRLISFRSKPTKLAHTRLLSTTATPYPLQYEMIISRPANSPHRQPGRRRSPSAASAKPRPDAEMGFNEWVDKKLSSKESDSTSTSTSAELAMDKSKRKYYNKRRKRMYGESESDEEGGRRRDESDFIELKQEVVELRTLHKREEELYFYDTFAYPWEKNKHYKMVYQMEKKYFPDQCFDKAFLEPGKAKAKQEKREARSEDVKEGEGDIGLVFFDEREGESKDVEVKGGDVTEKKVEDFFKCLKKVPNEKGGAPVPFLSSRSMGLPPKWDGPNGTVVLVNKPKGEIFYGILSES